MTRLVFGFAIAFPLMAQQFHIDHVTVAGKHLEAMRKVLGIPSEYGGPHSNHATEMALASFPDGSYLELIAIQPTADPAAVAAHEWHKFLESDGGPCAWAIRPVDFMAEAARLRAAQVAVTQQKSGRGRPDGVQLNWETAQIGPTRGGFFPFLIRDFTPRDNRVFLNGKPTTNDYSGVAKVVIGVRDLDAAIARYRQAYQLPAPERQEDAEFGAKMAWFPGTPVVLAAPLDAKSWLNARLDQFGEAPCAFILKSNSTVEARKFSHWFGASVVWLNTDKLAWHLGFEPK
jgi:hypothetical protein